MSNLAKEIRFIPRSVEDEGRIYRAKPIAWSPTSVVILNEYGATLVTAEREAHPLDLPDGDEVVLAHSGKVYTCWFDDEFIKVREHQFEGEQFVPARDSHTVAIGNVPSDELVVLGLQDGLEIWRDSPGVCQRICIIAHGMVKSVPSVICPRPVGKLEFSSGRIVAFTEDLGVRGRLVRLVDLDTNECWQVSSSYVFAAADRILAISTRDPAEDPSTNGLFVFGNGEPTFVDLPGPIIEAGGDATRAVVSIFTGGDAQLYEVTENMDGGLEVHILNGPNGYTALSPDGSLCANRGFSEAVIFRRTPHRQNPSIALHPEPPSKDNTVLHHGAQYVVSRTTKCPLGSIVHFHGGPESYEVPEGRYFGLPQWCNRNALDWIGVNYRGSLMPNTLCTRSAWHGWRDTLLDDFEGALKLAPGPIILLGWSFGAAIALSLGASTKRIRGILLGGSMGSLTRHVERAASLDSAHQNWFSTRFDLSGGDARFFNGINGFRKDLHVLEIHGEGDNNCPADLINEVAKLWENLHNPWSRLWIPSGEHYASTPQDAHLISTYMRNFVAQVLLD